MTSEVKQRREATERKYQQMKRNKAKREQPPKKEKPKFGMSSEEMKRLIEERRLREENANPTQVCKNCWLFPCFSGMENLSSNFALTCKKFKIKEETA